MKFYYYATIVVGILIILNAAGFNTPSGDLVTSFNIVNSTGDASLQNFKNSPLWSGGGTNSLVYILTIGVGASLVLGAFGRAPDIRYLTAVFVYALAGLILLDLVFLYVQLASYGVSWISWVATAIFGTALVGFIITIKEFWEGND